LIQRYSKNALAAKPVADAPNRKINYLIALGTFAHIENGLSSFKKNVIT